MKGERGRSLDTCLSDAKSSICSATDRCFGFIKKKFSLGSYYFNGFVNLQVALKALLSVNQNLWLLASKLKTRNWGIVTQVLADELLRTNNKLIFTFNMARLYQEMRFSIIFSN